MMMTIALTIVDWVMQYMRVEAMPMVIPRCCIMVF